LSFAQDWPTNRGRFVETSSKLDAALSVTKFTKKFAVNFVTQLSLVKSSTNIILNI